MKKWMIGIMLAAGLSVLAGTVGLPTERIALPLVDANANCLVCVWDESANGWLQAHTDYDNTGVCDFQVPEWGKWYWIGLWDSAKREYIFGKWVGHIKTDG